MLYYLMCLDLICRLQLQALTPMSKQEQLIRICTQSLLNATQSHASYLTNIFTNPCEYHTTLNVISNPYVAFMYCLTIKHHLKNCDHSQDYAQINDSKDYHGLDYNLEDAIRIAESTQFSQYLKCTLQTLEQNDYSELTGFQDATISKISKKSLTVKSSYRSKFWYESIIFINLLIYSKIKEESMSSLDQLSLYNGLQHLRFQLLAKLSITIQYQLGIHSFSNELFQDLLKKMVNYDDLNQQKSISDMINLIYELILYIQEEKQLIKVKKFARSLGRTLINLLMNCLKSLLLISPCCKKILNRSLLAINEYMTMITTCKSRRMYFGKIKLRDDEQGDFYQRKVYRADALMNFHFQFTSNAITIIDTANDRAFGQSIILCLEILDKITLISLSQESQDVFSNQRFVIFQENVNTFMSKLIRKWMKFSTIGIQNTDNNEEYYLQSLIINVLGNIFNNYLPFFLQNQELLKLSLNYCHHAINKIPINMALGEKSAITTIFFYLLDISKIGRMLENKEQILHHIRVITDEFLITCNAQEYRENYHSFSDENEAREMFFDPIIDLLQKIYIHEKKLLPCNHFTKLSDYLSNVENSQANRTTILDILMVEMIKNIESFQNQQFYHNKCGLAFKLLQRWCHCKSIKYLMLLDAISQQIIDEDAAEINSQTLYIWHYIQRQTAYTTHSIMKFLASEIIQFLLKDSSLYLANYAIHVLTRLCMQLIQVEKNSLGQSKGLISAYLTPVIDFVSRLDLTVLDNSDSYEQREKLLLLICVVGIKKIDDVFKIYYAIRTNLFKTYSKDQLKFIIDITGLLSYCGDENMEEVVLELIFNDLNQNSFIFQVFTLQNLNKELYFNIYADFLMKVMRKMERLKSKDALAADFQCIFCEKIDILSLLYDETSFGVIHELWVAFTNICRIDLKFPKLPSIIYNHTQALRVVDWMFRHLERLSDWQDIKILYRNTFERKYLEYEAHIEDKLKDDVIHPSNIPYYLFLLADYMEISQQDVFFDYRTVIATAMMNLYKCYKESNSSAMTLDSFGLDFDQFAGEECEQLNLAEFYNKSEYKKSINYLIRAFYIFDFVSNKIDRKYADFREEFLENFKKTVEDGNCA